MDTSIFSFIMSLAWCSIFILFGTILRRKEGFVLKYGVNFILLIMVVGIIRLFLPIDSQFSFVIMSKSVLPFCQQFLKTEVFQIFGFSVSRFDVFITIWAIGSSLFLVAIIIGIMKINLRVKRITATDNSQAQRIMKTIVLDSKPKQKYRIIVSEDVDTPMLVGLFTPTILLPSLSLADEEMKCVLLHEWNHFLHKHLWVKLFFNVLCALLWWNPLVYLLKNDLDYIQEVSCDRLVVNGVGDAERVKYVEATMNVMKQLANPKPQLALSSIGFIATNPEKIVQRCELVLFPPKRFNKRLQYSLSTALLALVVLSYVFIVQPFSAPPSDTEIRPDTEYISITPENSYLTANGDETYKLFVNGQFFDTISSSQADSLPYSSLPIKFMEENK